MSSRSPPSTLKPSSSSSLVLYPSTSGDQEMEDDSFGIDSEDAYDLVSSPTDVESSVDSASSSSSKSSGQATLPSWLAFPSLLTPSLSLGALFLPHTLAPIPIIYGALLLLFVTSLSAGAQSVWRGVGRYVRKDGLEDRVTESLLGSGRGERRQKWKRIVGGFVRIGMVCAGLGLGVTYLRSAVSLLIPLLSPHFISPALRPLLTLAFVIPLLGLSLSSPAQRVVPFVHIALFISLLIYSLYVLFSTSAPDSAGPSTSSETPDLSSIFHQQRGPLSAAILFQALSTLSFAPISLSPPVLPPSRPLIPRLSAALSPLFTLPLLLLPGSFPSSLPPAAPILAALLLLLNTARVLRTVVRPRIAGWRAGAVLCVVGTFIACVPEEWGLGRVVWDLVLASCLWYGYLLPAITHIILHHLRAPLSILFPSTLPLDGAADLLLLKKERSLQMRRETKRILHDLLVFGALLPIGVAMWGYAVGRVVRIW